MSEKPKSRSDAAHEHQNTDSVFDFLYYDARRVGSFLSQFQEFGHLQALSHKEGAKRGKLESGQVRGTGGIPGLAGVSGHHETGTSADYSEEAHRTFDPYWSNALSLLDYLQERQMLDRSIDSARIGQIALFSGHLCIRDLRLIQQAMKLPSLSGIIKDGGKDGDSRQVRRQKSRKQAEPQAGDEFGRELLG